MFLWSRRVEMAYFICGKIQQLHLKSSSRQVQNYFAISFDLAPNM